MTVILDKVYFLEYRYAAGTAWYMMTDEMGQPLVYMSLDGAKTGAVDFVNEHYISNEKIEFRVSCFKKESQCDFCTE